MPRPSDTNIEGSKWVFWTKYISNRIINRFKARLIGKSYTHLLGLDYTNTFSLVIKASTICMVLSLAITNHRLFTNFMSKMLFLTVFCMRMFICSSPQVMFTHVFLTIYESLKELSMAWNGLSMPRSSDLSLSYFNLDFLAAELILL